MEEGHLALVVAEKVLEVAMVNASREVLDQEARVEDVSGMIYIFL